MTTPADRTMRAVLHHRYGTAEVLRLGRVPRPVIGDDDVLVEVRAAGLDRGTEHLITGKPYAMRLAFGMVRPREPGPRPRRRRHRRRHRRGSHAVRSR